MIIEILGSINSFWGSSESQQIEDASFSYVKVGAALALTFAGIAIFELFRRNHFQLPNLGIFSSLQTKPIQNITTSEVLEKPLQRSDDPMAKEKAELIEACRNGDLDFIKKTFHSAQKDLLFRGLDNGDNTLLYYSVLYKQMGVLKYLVEKGAVVDIKNSSGFSPFELAIQKGDIEIVKIFLPYKPDLLKRIDEDRTPLNEAIFQKNLELAKLLIENGAEVDPLKDVRPFNFMSIYGITPLHEAILSGDVDMVQLMLDHKADVNRQNNWRYNSLHFAVQLEISQNHNIPKDKIDPENIKKIIHLLLEKGADKKVQNRQGLTPKEFAGQNKAFIALAALQ